VEDDTALLLLKAVAEAAGDDCICLRHHPQDVAVDFRITTSALLRAREAGLQALEKSVTFLETPETNATYALLQVTAGPGVANAVRRALMVYPMVLRCQEVQVYEGHPSCPDEILAHRLGQMPLTAPAHVGKAHGTLHTSQSPVTPKDIVWSPDSVSPAPGSEDDVLITLPAGSSLRLEVHAERVDQRTHAKATAVAAPFYEPAIVVTSKVSKAQRDALGAKGLTLLRKQKKQYLQAPLGTRLEYLKETWPDISFSHSLDTIFIGVENLGSLPSAKAAVLASLDALRQEIQSIVHSIIALRGLDEVAVRI